MGVTSSISEIRNCLNCDESDEWKLMMIKQYLPNEEEYKFRSMKKLLLDWAKGTIHKKFRLLAAMNEPQSIFNWYDN